MYVQGEQRGQHPDHHDQPNVSSLNLSVTLHVLDPVTPYNENKQTASRHEVHYKRTLMSGYSFVSCH